jgi:hypothetical protein
MKPNLRKIFSVIGIFLLGALVGGAIAGYGTSYFLGKFMMYGSTLSEMVAIKSNVFTLTKLRAGNSAEAINHLEMMLDGNLIYFSGGIHGTASEQTDIRKALKTAKEYRQQNPRSTKYPGIDNAVAAALSEAEK